MTSISCHTCGTTQLLRSRVDMWPLYYFGGAPEVPQDADMYFCGSVCATKHYEEKRNDR